MAECPLSLACSCSLSRPYVFVILASELPYPRSRPVLHPHTRHYPHNHHPPPPPATPDSLGDPFSSSEPSRRVWLLTDPWDKRGQRGGRSSPVQVRPPQRRGELPAQGPARSLSAGGGEDVAEGLALRGAAEEVLRPSRRRLAEQRGGALRENRGRPLVVHHLSGAGRRGCRS